MLSYFVEKTVYNLYYKCMFLNILLRIYTHNEGKRLMAYIY